jgi:hypothetical protein
MIRVKGLNQIPRVQSNSIQIQVQTCFLIFIWNPLTFGQSVEYKSCSKCPNLLPEFVSFFLKNLCIFWDLFLLLCCLKIKLKNQKPFFPSRAGPAKPTHSANPPRESAMRPTSQRCLSLAGPTPRECYATRARASLGI